MSKSAIENDRITAMVEETPGGFPKGRVAETLRKILSPNLTEHGVEAVTVCLLSHLLVERNINSTLFNWLKLDAPRKEDAVVTERASEELWKKVVKMNFAQKYALLEPHFAMYFPKEAGDVWKLNDLRNDIFHGHAVANAKFDGSPISNEETVENIFHCAQYVTMRFAEFWELVDSPHAIAEKWEKRLKELGQPLR